METAPATVMHPEPSPSRTPTTNDLRSLMRLDHERLERLFNDLLAAFEADARVEMARLWSDFDRELRAHFSFEEKQLMPKFIAIDAAEGLALMREHDRIREKLVSLGIGVDLHYTRQSQVADFVSELRAHAAREDALFYRWSHEHLRDEGLRETVRRRLSKTA